MPDLTPQQRESFERFKAWKHRPKVKATDDASVSSPQQVYAEMMKATFGPLLRSQGLRGSGGRFELASEDYWALRGFQKSAYSDGHEVQFTVNLSVVRRDVWAERPLSRRRWVSGRSPQSCMDRGLTRRESGC